MDYNQIRELIQSINNSNIGELSIEQGDFKISIRQVRATESQVVQLTPGQNTQPLVAAPSVSSVMQSVSASQASPASAESASGKTIAIKSPMIGTFYRSPSPDKPAFVSVGDEIAPGKVICIIEAMKLFNEIESEVSGRIVKVLADDASPVEYDQPLFLIEPI